jgi:polyisoprenoid-binding protein YceI
MDIRPLLRRRRTWLIAIPIIAVLLFIGGPFVYINFIEGDPPKPLTFASGTVGDDTSDNATTTTVASATRDGIDGAWAVSEGQAGYRVKEVLFGQDTEAVGRTSSVTGSLVIADTEISSASFEVDLTTIESSESRRDNQFKGRIMDTSSFPTATFTLTEPIALGAMPADLEEITATATGDFTIRGVTKRVTFDLTARRNGDRFEVNGSIPVVFADFDIPDPSFGPATVQDHGEIEFLLTFTPSQATS